MNDEQLIQYLDILPLIDSESVYVIDVSTNKFCYVSTNELFRCGYSVEEILKLGYDFYKEIVHPEDLRLWNKMRTAVLLNLKYFEEKKDEIDYISCTFRLQHKFSFLPSHPLPQMVYHRMQPFWKNEKIQYLICFIRTSATKKTGNLRIYYKDGLTYEEYNISTQRWKQKTIIPLTEREQAILMLAQQGKNSEEIADCLCKGRNTIRNQIKPLFAKLSVHSMREAVDFVYSHNMILSKKDIKWQHIEMNHKRSRVLLQEGILLRIQQHLDNGKSNRQVAKLEGTTEGTIRYWIRKGILMPTKK